ncbi:unnamed protein product [Merluccius merluccius]
MLFIVLSHVTYCSATELHSPSSVSLLLSPTHQCPVLDYTVDQPPLNSGAIRSAVGGGDNNETGGGCHSNANAATEHGDSTDNK